MDYSEAEILVETVDEIWTLWGDIFDIEFQLSTMPTFSIWIRDQLRNVERLKVKSRKLPNITKFNEIKNEFIAEINKIYQQNSATRTTFMTQKDKEPTTSMIRSYKTDMIAISGRLTILHENDKHTKYETNSTHDDTNSSKSAVKWLYLEVDKIWDLLHEHYQMSFNFTKSTANMTKTDWNKIQTQNISNFSTCLSHAHVNYTLNETQKEFITMLVRMKQIDLLETEYATYVRIIIDINDALKRIPTPVHLALDRLISICEKLADQKKLAR